MTEAMTTSPSEPVSPMVAPWLARFEAARRALPGAGRPWAEALRSRGMDGFAARGFPSRKVEAWKYTDLKKLAKVSFEPAPVAVDGLSDALRGELAALDPASISAVFVNGHFRPDLSSLSSLPEGARLTSLALLLERGDPLPAAHLDRVLGPGERPLQGLNTALMQDGFVLELATGVTVEAPIRLVFLTEASGPPIACFPRNLVVAGPNSAATLVETWRGLNDGAYFQNAVTEIVVAQGARLHHYRLQDEGCRAFHLAQSLIRLEAHASYDSFTLALGAEWSRAEAEARLDGPGGSLRIAGAYLARGSQHMDNTTLIDHAQPDCRSREVFKGVLDDRARGVFQGKILVRRGAQRTDGYQLNRALLLSKTAEIDSKPELEIYADDVKCSHGATAGEIDHDALFYLRARGIDETAARALLVEAFVQEAIEEVEVDAVREEFAAAVAGWLAARDTGKEAA